MKKIIAFVGIGLLSGIVIGQVLIEENIISLKINLNASRQKGLTQAVTFWNLSHTNVPPISDIEYLTTRVHDILDSYAKSVVQEELKDISIKYESADNAKRAAVFDVLKP